MDNNLPDKKSLPTCSSNSETNSPISERNVQNSDETRMVEQIFPAVDGGSSNIFLVKTS